MFEKIQLMMELKTILSELQNAHPRALAFFNALRTEGLEPDSVIEVRLTRPDGRSMVTNLRLSEADLQNIDKLKRLASEAEGRDKS